MGSVVGSRQIPDIKAERLQLRLDVNAKGRLQRAAGHRHESLSQFVLRSALQEAEKVIHENESVTLSEADWKLFYDALIDPPAPNAALKKAYGAYRSIEE